MWRGGLIVETVGAVLIGALCAAAWGQGSGQPQPADKPGPGTDKPDHTSVKESAAQETPDRGAVKPRRPSPEAILKAFQEQRPTNAPVRSTPSQNPRVSRQAAREHDTGRLLREGEYINNVAGRLEREGQWWTFVFESDSPGAPKPPMRLLPNQKLEIMARAQEASTSSIVFEVSGEITLFASRNYLLVRKSLRRRGTDNLRK